MTTANDNLLDLVPPSLEWRVYAGDTSELKIVVINEQDEAVDLTAWTFTSKVRLYPGEGSVLTTPTVNKNANLITLALTNSAVPKQSYFDLQGVNSITGQTKTFIRGVITKEKDVTY